MALGMVLCTCFHFNGCLVKLPMGLFYFAQMECHGLIVCVEIVIPASKGTLMWILCQKEGFVLLNAPFKFRKPVEMILLPCINHFLKFHTFTGH